MNNGVRKIHSPIDFTSNSESKESVNCFQPIVDTKLLAWPPLPEILAVSVISIAIAFSSTSASQPLHSTSTPCYALRLKGKPVLHTAEIHAQRSLSSHTPRKSMIGSGVHHNPDAPCMPHICHPIGLVDWGSGWGGSPMAVPCVMLGQ